jgi:hypothetical protein
LSPLISLGCGTASEADTTASTARASARPAIVREPALAHAPTSGHSAAAATATAEPAAAPAAAPGEPEVPGEPSLGVTDKGIWSDLDEKIQLRLPPDLTPERVSARISAYPGEPRALLVVAIDGFPRKVYPLTGTAMLQVGPHALALRPGDRAELARLLSAERLTVASDSAPAPSRARDADRDGIPDPLDVLIGAKKTALNADAYTEGYITMKFPMGDVPREIGVCTDVIVRAVRNAGIDLQKVLHDDILRARRAYPMIKGQPDPQIDHRRVATLLPYFLRHWEKHTEKIDDPKDPLRPGDILFMDTFPSRSGPDHVGIVSDTIGPAGLPMIINNWTTGTVTAEMDLLTFVPVLYRFRLPE